MSGRRRGGGRRRGLGFGVVFGGWGFWGAWRGVAGGGAVRGAGGTAGPGRVRSRDVTAAVRASGDPDFCNKPAAPSLTEAEQSSSARLSSRAHDRGPDLLRSACPVGSGWGAWHAGFVVQCDGGKAGVTSKTPTWRGGDGGLGLMGRLNLECSRAAAEFSRLCPPRRPLPLAADPAPGLGSRLCGSRLSASGNVTLGAAARAKVTMTPTSGANVTLGSGREPRVALSGRLPGPRARSPAHHPVTRPSPTRANRIRTCCVSPAPVAPRHERTSQHHTSSNQDTHSAGYATRSD